MTWDTTVVDKTLGYIEDELPNQLRWTNPSGTAETVSGMRGEIAESEDVELVGILPGRGVVEVLRTSQFADADVTPAIGDEVVLIENSTETTYHVRNKRTSVDRVTIALDLERI